VANTASLKSLTPDLAPLLGITQSALYERQRALERAGLLKAESGRGPGSGVRATPKAVAALIASALATDSLSEVETEALVLARLRAEDGVCPVTGKRAFGQALSALLASPEMSAKTLEIIFWRGEKRARIDFIAEKPPIDKTCSAFGSGLNPTRLLRIQASLEGFPLVQIANLLREGDSDPSPGWTKQELYLLTNDLAFAECWGTE
jgi:hypothetical protein